jgi:sugar transferase (PEP-CTERM/EpsH1 system associated)
MRPLSVLFVTTRFPLPLLSGDRARAWHQLRLLSRRHRCTLLTFAGAGEAERSATLLESHGVRVIAVPFARVPAVLRLGRAVFSSRPLQSALFDAPQARAELRRLLTAESFDLVHVQLARAMPLLPVEMSVPVVVDLIDALSLNMRRRAAHDRGVLGWAARIDARRLEAYEQRICGEAAASLVVAEADRAAIGRTGGLNGGPLVNPNGVDLEAFPLRADPRDRFRLVFTGNLGYFPNIDAMTWFVDQVLPRIWRDEPSARLTIAGARPHARIRALAARDNRIEVAGDVAHLHPFIAGARVAVAPMRAGSGQLLKILEAMATGTPVVTTSRGLSGIDAVAGEHALVADAPDDFARHVVSLVRDDGRAAALAAAGRGLVERLYTWERSVSQLERVYLKVLGCDENAATCA